jgi:hypothetical protein
VGSTSLLVVSEVAQSCTHLIKSALSVEQDGPSSSAKGDRLDHFGLDVRPATIEERFDSSERL